MEYQCLECEKMFIPAPLCPGCAAKQNQSEADVRQIFKEANMEIFELIEWHDRSTGPEMENYTIEERSLGLFPTEERARQEIEKINNDRRKFHIRKREISA